MAVFIFWAVAIAIMLAVAALFVAALSRSRGEATGAAAYDLQLFRDQLKEVDRDLARALISQEEAARLRTEISRRILAADASLGPAGHQGPQGDAAKSDTASGASPAKEGPSLLWSAALVLAVTLAVTLGTYLARGTPAEPDQPMRLRLAEAAALRASRPTQAEAEAAFTPPPLAQPADPSHLELVEKLREVMAQRPDDLQGQELLARNEAGLGNFPAAARAQAAVLHLKGPEAPPEDLAFAAEMMILAAGGLVTPEAEALLTRLLQRDPDNGVARFQSGRLMLQTARPDLAFRFWAPLWEESPDGAYWLPILQSQLPELAWLAGQHRYSLPARRAAAPLAGPGAADIEAAAALSPQERSQMIEGMVEGLMARLASEGGTAPEWAQLLRALGVLQDETRARAIYAEALERFAGRSEDLSLIRAAAQDAGIAP